MTIVLVTICLRTCSSPRPAHQYHTQCVGHAALREEGVPKYTCQSPQILAHRDRPSLLLPSGGGSPSQRPNRCVERDEQIESSIVASFKTNKNNQCQMCTLSLQKTRNVMCNRCNTCCHCRVQKPARERGTRAGEGGPG